MKKKNKKKYENTREYIESSLTKEIEILEEIDCFSQAPDHVQSDIDYVIEQLQGIIHDLLLLKK